MDDRQKGEISRERRLLLAALAPLGLGAIAGCTGNDGGEPGDVPDDGDGDTDADGDAPPDDEGDDGDQDPDDEDGDGDEEPEESEEILTEEPVRSDRVTFATWEEIDAVRELVKAGEESWASAFESMMANASTAMGATPRSVVDSGVPHGGDSAHEFATDSPYQGQDGQVDETRNAEDADALHDMSEWILNAALAYAFTGEDRYAERAIDLLHHWCLDPDTYMVPTNVNHGPHTRGYEGNWGISLYTSIPGMFYGASLVADHPYWDEEYDGVEELDEWAATTLADTERYGVSSGSNGTSWRAVLWLTLAAYLDDQESLRRGYNFWTRGFIDLTADGLLERELSRVTSLRYSLYALEAMLVGAEIARRQGVDLHSYSVEHVDGSALRTIADAHAPYALDPSEWPHSTGTWGPNQFRLAAYPYELLYSEWQEDVYLEIAERGGRLHDHRALGIIPLIHGEQFANGVEIEKDTERIPAAFDADLEFDWVDPGGSTVLTTSLYNPSSLELSEIAFEIESDDDLAWATEDEPSVDALAPEDTHTVDWEVEFPDTEDVFELTVRATYVQDGEEHEQTDTLAPEAISPGPAETLTTDFGEHEPELGPPEGWRADWEDRKAVWGIVEGEEYAGGKALQFEAGDNRRYALVWEAAPDDVRDAEVLTKTKVPEIADLGNHARIILRGGGGGDEDETGFYFDLREEGFAIYTYPAADQLAQTGTTESDTWYFIRFSAIGPHVRLKFWEPGTPEPDAWDLEVVDTSNTSGWIGVGSFDSEPSLWDFVSVGTGGERAPMPDWVDE